METLFSNISKHPFLLLLAFFLLGAIIFVSALLARGLLRRRRLRAAALNTLQGGYEFEAYLAGLLDALGYRHIHTTKKSGDFGVDVLAERDGVTFAIQAKLYSQPVGVKAVQEVLAGKAYYRCHVGVVATNSSFTRNAEELAEKTGILLWDEQTLLRMETAVRQ